MHTPILSSNTSRPFQERLHRRSPLAAGFSFRTELFITEWPTRNLTAGEALFWHSSHQNRTRPLVDRVKNLLMMDRVVLASVWTHNFTAKPGFDRYDNKIVFYFTYTHFFIKHLAIVLANVLSIKLKMFTLIIDTCLFTCRY